jgi:hypothetical protein
MFIRWAHLLTQRAKRSRHILFPLFFGFSFPMHLLKVDCGVEKLSSLDVFRSSKKRVKINSIDFAQPQK